MPATQAASSIIVGGAQVPLGVPYEPTPIVLTWHDHGISFAPGEGFNKKRKQKIDLAVWHWTGGEQEPPQMAQVLKQRGYGVEFAISRTGVIYQFVDPLEVDTADAAGVNARSVGIEIVSYGMRGSSPGWLVPKSGQQRPTRRVKVHGIAIEVAAFLPMQLAAARSLAAGLSTALKIPRRVPTGPDGAPTTKQLSAPEISTFTGHVGHYHISRQKCDPGPDFMMELHAAFAAYDV